MRRKKIAQQWRSRIFKCHTLLHFGVFSGHARARYMDDKAINNYVTAACH